MRLVLPLICIVLSACAASAVHYIDPFEYYKFGIGPQFTELVVDKSTYAGGDTVIGFYRLKNMMGSPIAEGKTRIQVFFNDPLHGEQLFDEFFATTGISMLDQISIQKEFFFALPPNAPSGDYTLKAYFQANDYFNLAGLSFACYGPPGAAAKITSFKVESQRESYLVFDNERININGDIYRFHSLTPVFQAGDEILIEVPIINKGPGKHVTLIGATYEWDDSAMSCYLPEKAVLYEYDIVPNGEEKAAYRLSGLSPGTYQVKLQANSGWEKTILKIRFSVEGDAARIYYQGLSDFPLKKGEAVDIFATYSYSSSYSGSCPGSIEFMLKDSNGNEVYSDSTQVFFVASPTGSAAKYIPDDELSVLSLTVTLYDENGGILDTRTSEYDISNFEGVEKRLQIVEFSRDGSFIVSYRDADGRDLRGSIFAFVLDEGAYPVYHMEFGIEGEAQHVIGPLSYGSYTLRVTELNSGLSSHASLVIEEDSFDKPKRRPVFLYAAVGAAIILIALVIYRYKK